MAKIQMSMLGVLKLIERSLELNKIDNALEIARDAIKQLEQQENTETTDQEAK